MSSIQSQVQSQLGDLIGEVRGKSNTTTIKEITPFGVRISSNGVGQFTGRYTASHMDTVSVSLNRDGTSQWATKAIQTTTEGDFIVVTARGTGNPTSPTSVKFEGEVAFMTESPKLSWLNTTKGRMEGTSNQATGEYQAKFYSQKK
jgi:hypothetical protein